MNYDKEYFIKKFEAIPEEKIIEGNLMHYYHQDCGCALGQCGMKSYDKPTDEAIALVKVFSGLDPKVHGDWSGNEYTDYHWKEVWEVNDASGRGLKFAELRELPTPKQRILYKLNSL